MRKEEADEARRKFALCSVNATVESGERLVPIVTLAYPAPALTSVGTQSEHHFPVVTGGHPGWRAGGTAFLFSHHCKEDTALPEHLPCLTSYRKVFLPLHLPSQVCFLGFRCVFLTGSLVEQQGRCSEVQCNSGNIPLGSLGCCSYRRAPPSMHVRRHSIPLALPSPGVWPALAGLRL